MKDWEVHAAKLWAKDSAKFARPTPRQLEQPVFEVHEPLECMGDVVVVIITVVAALVLAVGFTSGWIK